MQNFNKSQTAELNRRKVKNRTAEQSELNLKKLLKANREVIMYWAGLEAKEIHDFAGYIPLKERLRQNPNLR